MSVKAFNVSEFHSKLNQVGTLNAAAFLFECTVPNVIPADKVDADTITLLAHACSSPEFGIITTETRPWGQGSAFKMPYDSSHGDISVTFWADSQMKVYDFFLAWMKNIVSSTGDLRTSMNGLYDNEVRYRREYISTVVINQFDSNAKINQIIMGGAWPTSISAISMDWSQNTSFSTFSVNFTFRNFKLKRVNEVGETRYVSGENAESTIGDLNRFGVAGTNFSPVGTSSQLERFGVASSAFGGELLSDPMNTIYSAANAASSARKLQSASISSAWDSLANAVTTAGRLGEIGGVIRGIAQNARVLNDFVSNYSGVFSNAINNPTQLAALTAAFGSGFVGDFSSNWSSNLGDLIPQNIGIFNP